MEREKAVKATEGFQRQIGTTVYQVNVIFSKQTEESFEDKLLHLLKNDLSFAQKDSNNAGS